MKTITVYIQEGFVQYEMGEIEIPETTDPLVAATALVLGFQRVTDELTEELKELEEIL
jgi:hypothetical protein